MLSAAATFKLFESADLLFWTIFQNFFDFVARIFNSVGQACQIRGPQGLLKNAHQTQKVLEKSLDFWDEY